MTQLTVNAMDKLNRQTAIKANMDCFGNQWGISLVEGTSLYCVGKAPDDGSGPVEVPQHWPHLDGEDCGLSGRYTKPDIAQQAIEGWLHKSWDWSDAKKQKKERKDYVSSAATAT